MFRIKIFIGSVLAFLYMAGFTAAEIPRMINYQGRLTDSEGAPITDTLDITFSIYNQQSDGDMLWQEIHSGANENPVAVIDGLFSVMLGSHTVIPETAFNGPESWLSIVVSGEPEISPRTRIISVAYAYQALNADTAGYVTGGNSFWSIIDSVLTTINYWGIARGASDNAILGDSTNTFVNLGVACTTGQTGYDYSFATITGGRGNKADHDFTTVGGGEANKATQNYSTIGGGYGNTANNNWSTVSGGIGNSAQGGSSVVAGGSNNASGNGYASILGGKSNQANGLYSTVGGGEQNIADGQYSAVAGGTGNTTVQDYDFVGGGDDNRADGLVATIAGGAHIIASGQGSAVGGGGYHKARGNYSVVSGGGGSLQADSNAAIGHYSTVGGGRGNIAEGEASTVAGGYQGKATQTYASVGGGQSCRAEGQHAAVFGGKFNAAITDYGYVGGGDSNQVGGIAATVSGGAYALALGKGSTVGGGGYNRARGDYSVVAGGGGEVQADSNSASGSYSVIGGGAINTASNNWSTVAGGTGNKATGIGTTIGGGVSNIAENNRSVVCGGNQNRASGHYSSVMGGENNIASGEHSAVPGGRNNGAIANYSLAAGSYAKANHAGSIVLSANDYATSIDSVRSGGTEQMVLRADGGIYITNISEQAPYDASKLINTVSGAYLSSAGVWNDAPKLGSKSEAVEGKSLLGSLDQLPIRIWRNGENKHISPVPEEFYKLFGFGNNDASISAADQAAVALACIQELYRMVVNQKLLAKELESKNNELAEVKAEVNQLKMLVETLIESSHDEGSNADGLALNR